MRLGYLQIIFPAVQNRAVGEGSRYLISIILPRASKKATDCDIVPDRRRSVTFDLFPTTAQLTIGFAERDLKASTTNGGFQNVTDLITHTTDADFDTDVVNSEQPVLLDFWAEWCGPCKMISPILESIAGEYQSRLRVVKLNIDENPQTPPKYNIRSIPTLLLFRDGSVAAQQVGAVSKAQLESFLDANLA